MLKSLNVKQFVKVSNLVLIRIILRGWLIQVNPYTLCISVWHGTWLWHWLKLKLYLLFLPFRKLCEFRAGGEVQQVSHALSQLRLVFVWMKNRYTKIWVNLRCTWEHRELLGCFLKSALITGYHFSSAEWQLTSWCGFRQGMVLMLGTVRSPPGYVFTVTSVWLTRSKTRWIFNHSPSAFLTQVK